ncbi:MAG TPA: hypothetical protein VFX16_28385 [Pseudonocardiaceae bacterium]|nr:hypothetical protein [Pseudonocardiaceae bacterium]
MTTSNATTGILDPDDPGCWLVPPWPVDSGFGEVVRHFLAAYLARFQSGASVACQLAYYEGYLAALVTAPTDELRDSVGLRRRAELLSSVGDCVAQFRGGEVS